MCCSLKSRASLHYYISWSGYNTDFIIILQKEFINLSSKLSRLSQKFYLYTFSDRRFKNVYLQFLSLQLRINNYILLSILPCQLQCTNYTSHIIKLPNYLPLFKGKMSLVQKSCRFHQLFMLIAGKQKAKYTKSWKM